MRMAKAYELETLPGTYLIDPEGNIQMLFDGTIHQDMYEEHITPIITAE